MSSLVGRPLRQLDVAWNTYNMLLATADTGDKIDKHKLPSTYLQCCVVFLGLPYLTRSSSAAELEYIEQDRYCVQVASVTVHSRFADGKIRLSLLYGTVRNATGEFLGGTTFDLVI